MKLTSLLHIVAITCPVAPVLAADQLPATEDSEDARPSVFEMRRFIASQITDEQAKMIIEKSKKEVEAEKARAASEVERFWQERAERLGSVPIAGIEFAARV